MTEEIQYATEAQRYENYSLPTLSIWVWEACVRKYGMGGTPECNRAFRKIMASIFFELDLPLLEKEDNHPRPTP